MKYPLVPLINDLTFPVLFFWFCLPFGILLILLIFWFQHLLKEAQVPITKEIKMPPSDNPDGNIELPSESESRDDSQTTPYRRASKIDTRMTSPVKNLGPRPAHLSSKITVKRKGLCAVISDRLDQCIKQYCSENNSVYNTLVLLCVLLTSLLFSLLCQLVEVSSLLRIQLLPSSLFVRPFRLLAWLGEKPVKIMISLKQEISALSASIMRKKEKNNIWN